MHRPFAEEAEWLDTRTSFIDRIVPFLSHKVLVKSAILMLFLVFIYKYKEIFFTSLAVIAISYVRFRRNKIGINIEIEPSYVLSIILSMLFGYKYGMASILLPGIATVATSGLSIGVAVNITNKIIVMSGAYLFWRYLGLNAWVIWVALALVILTDIGSFSIRKNFGQPVHEILQVIASNSIIRLAYFSLMLEPLVRVF